MKEVVHFVQEVVNQLDTNQLVLIAGIATTVVHNLLKRYKDLSKAVNIVVSFVLPIGGAILATLVGDGSLLVRYPEVFAVAQGSYRVWQIILTTATWLKLGKEAAGSTSVAPEASLASTENF